MYVLIKRSKLVLFPLTCQSCLQIIVLGLATVDLDIALHIE